jgi:hypothetical protein
MSGTTAIPASQIVSVIPSVLSAGGTALDLNGLILTGNTRVPVDQVLSFPNLPGVQGFFGAQAQESMLAQSYFLGSDNSTAKPGSLLFAQYNQAAVNAWLRGATVAGMTIAELQAIPPATLTVEIDGTEQVSALITLSGAVSFSNAAELIAEAIGATGPQTAAFTGSIAGAVLTVTAMTPGGTINVGDEVKGASVTPGTMVVSYGTGTGQLGTYNLSDSQTITSGALTTDQPCCVYDSVTHSFKIQSGTTGATTSSIGYASGGIATELNLTQTAGATLSQGADPETPAVLMAEVAAITSNWASFLTTMDPDAGAGNAIKQEFAAWTNGSGNRFVYLAWDQDVSPTLSISAANSLGQLLNAANSSGTICIYSPVQGANIAAFVAGAIASLDFGAAEGRSTLAFRAQSGMAPDVTNGTVASNLEANHYNYYGIWATSNDRFQFLYPGSISGPFVWADSYVDQIWMNNEFQLNLMVLLTNEKSLPYNQLGYTKIKAACQVTINDALNFGAIRTGVTLSPAQIAQVNADAGVQIDRLIYTQGYYMQVRDASPAVRAQRGSPPCSFWYADGGSIQRINLASVELQ